MIISFEEYKRRKQAAEDRMTMVPEKGTQAVSSPELEALITEMMAEMAKEYGQAEHTGGTK